ncbi:retinoic acid receptor responder protein 2 isoform X1 [Pipistrellus kuhlii]|uniref:retinoic acid receptor responder protein 2 isoform X1 n=1 Tax=Pipistrellus kuhlii TaxID=59472 RepID=UPI001E26F27B|nr:retinoic acid receptor responder protein 2 isoform X1 [Pipistrellus kuhlii]XP_045434573.1 retinoic acid receptor responder protein 2 isoform X1 [Pipistrellus kuhlii]
MWQLLMLLALWLGTVGLGRAELTAAQQQGLQVALEDFHKHPRVQWAFQKTSVDIAMDKPSPAGTFVRLEFTLQQTGCVKKDWKRTECKVKPNGRKRKCLACIKLSPEFKVLERMVHCPTEMQSRQNPVLFSGQLWNVTSESALPSAQGRTSDEPQINKNVLTAVFSPPLALCTLLPSAEWWGGE